MLFDPSMELQSFDLVIVVDTHSEILCIGKRICVHHLVPDLPQELLGCGG
jgi:hypothetical protein